ncbi:hypothetical protein [Thermaurantiacus tibetensis]|uniref:hypothetical protein n=1 Tax=Thermaurantiacus tibetensis TaxID=2759035 RepID=UPI00188F4B7C|nr:hypothetical protein [Thermaurantiacus tibetensis]
MPRALAAALLLLLAGAATALLLARAGRDEGTPAVAPPPAASPTAAPSAAAAPVPAPEAMTDAALREAADSVLAALATRNGAALATHVHPQGLRVSPSAFVDRETDVLLSPAEVARMFEDPRPRRWGFAEGSGDPIDLSAAAYVAQHVPAAEALAQRRVTLDGTAWQSNTFNNIAQVYPGARVVEYLVEADGDPELADFRRRAIRLVFREAEGAPRLVGLVADGWSP